MVDEVEEKSSVQSSVKHDSQEEEFDQIARSEGDKFDSRLFWFAGGVSALSLGYFQTTGLLRIDGVLIAGYSCLIVGITVLLFSLWFTSYRYGETSKRFRTKNERLEKEDSIDEICDEIKQYGDTTSKWVDRFNLAAMILVLIGTILIVVYMFINGEETKHV